VFFYRKGNPKKKIEKSVKHENEFAGKKFVNWFFVFYELGVLKSCFSIWINLI